MKIDPEVTKSMEVVDRLKAFCEKKGLLKEMIYR